MSVNNGPDCLTDLSDLENICQIIDSPESTEELFDTMLLDLLDDETSQRDVQQKDSLLHIDDVSPNDLIGSLPADQPLSLTVTRRYRRKQIKNEDHKYRKVEGRKRKVNPSYMPALRVLKKDIRRKYQEMYTNVINQHDPLLLQRFLSEFCVPSCQYLFHLPAMGSPISIGNTLSDILFGLIQIQLKLPDMVQQFSDVEIHVPYHTPGSHILSSAKFQGTKLFQLPVDPLADAVQQSSSSSPLLLSLSTTPPQVCSIVVQGNVSDLQISEASAAMEIDLNQSSSTAPEVKVFSAQSLPSAHLFSPWTRKGERPNQDPEGLDHHIDLQLLPKLQSLQLFPLVTPQEIILEGSFSMHLNTSFQIESFQFQVKKVIKEAYHLSPH